VAGKVVVVVVVVVNGSYSATPYRRSGITLAMCHRLSGLSTYGLNGQRKGGEHLAYAPDARV